MKCFLHSFLVFIGLSVAAYAETKLTVGKQTLASPLEPMRVTVPSGERVELVFPALSGNQWLKNGLPITGAIGRRYVIESAQVSDTGTYRVSYTGIHPIDSQDVILRVAAAPSDAAVSTGSNDGSFLTFTSRGIAGCGAQSLVAGFIVSETAGNPFADHKVLVRAVGPTLTAFDVRGALGKPRLQVFDSTGQLCLPSPADAEALQRAERASGAFPLKAGAGDAVLLLNLSPGVYTAQVSADDCVAGLALLEVYKVP